MEVRVLIDSIVQQTTVLIAQLATAGGVRAPLADVANRVFLDLVNELEGQGLGRKVIADMFGMALRSYQQKVQRLSESATDRGVTLWEATYSFLQEQEVATRQEILKRFRHDREANVRGILNDLTESGLIYRSGRGDATMYRIIPEEDVTRLGQGAPMGLTTDIVCVAVYQHSPVSRESLAEALTLDDEVLDHALASLVADGRVAQLDGEGGEPARYSTDSCLIPLGDDAGWPAGVFDHFQAVVTAISAKLQNGRTRALPSDQIGGSTFRYDIWPGHPLEEDVLNMLAETRQRSGDLWDRVMKHGEAHAGPRDKRRVTFYFGQSIQLDNTLEGDE